MPLNNSTKQAMECVWLGFVSIYSYIENCDDLTTKLIRSYSLASTPRPLQSMLGGFDFCALRHGRQRQDAACLWLDINILLWV